MAKESVKNKSIFEKTSFVFGLISVIVGALILLSFAIKVPFLSVIGVILLFSFGCLGTIFISIIGIVFSFMEKKHSSSHAKKGLILSVIGLILGIVIVIVLIVLAVYVGQYLQAQGISGISTSPLSGLQ